jgi:hypothetical protein
VRPLGWVGLSTVDDRCAVRGGGGGKGIQPMLREACGSRMIPEVHSALVLEIRRLDGRLFFLDSDDLIRISGDIGVVGGVEKVSASGDGDARLEGMGG